MVEGVGTSGYTQKWRGGRVVECGGLENRYVGNPGVGGSNPPLSASRAGQRFSFLPLSPYSAGASRPGSRQRPSKNVSLNAGRQQTTLSLPTSYYHAEL
jgi:hypothetical protein